MPQTHIPNLLFDLSCRISYPYGISTPCTPYATLPAIPTPPPTPLALEGYLLTIPQFLCVLYLQGAMSLEARCQIVYCCFNKSTNQKE